MAIAMNLSDATSWFLSKQSMSPKKLQKMLYYAYSWGLVFLNEDPDNLDNKLFDTQFQAWVHGPVIPKTYTDYKGYGFKDIPKADSKSIERLKLDSEVEDILNQVFEVYGEFSGNQLEALTHSEDPWKIARKDCLPMDPSTNLIDDRIIYNYYSSQIGA
ncbi:MULTISPECIES: Panacea domain-containing protein [unclassified Enterococcus]|uniref:Panacea domain-containing protein n=1 Tax=unclassified Enterococcus TaxID=2608891 RepID=UPI000A348D0E|nr:type II toxin-antitoxin system antitoxin SocA domain-containing protein [Enterococcus sp. 5B7_DIV0075]OTP23881.1 hypothetical protein A5800_001739 [Enterococcus sp. 5B7_DIV0075]